MCWYRLPSPIGFKLSQGAGEADLFAKLMQAWVILGCRN